MHGDDTTRKPPEQRGVDCAEFEVLLADALDGRLDAAQIERFDAHLASCRACAPMFGESKLGQAFLQTLNTEEVEPPPFVMENILRETVGTVHTRVKVEEKKSWIDRIREVKWLEPVIATVRQPRFAMSFGMAFFSISMLMNVFGLKMSSLKDVDLRPTAIKKTYYETTGKVQKYYENIRWIYELESQLQALRGATQTGAANTTQSSQENAKPETDPSAAPGNDENNKSREQAAPAQGSGGTRSGQ